MQISELIEMIKKCTDKKGRIRKMPEITVLTMLNCLEFHRGVLKRQSEILEERFDTIQSLENDLDRANALVENGEKMVPLLENQIRGRVREIEKLLTAPGRATRDERAELKEMRTAVYRRKNNPVRDSIDVSSIISVLSTTNNWIQLILNLRQN